MSPEPQSPETIFGEAIAIESPVDRAAFLDRACQHDPDLRRELEKLVMDHFRAGDFLEKPAAKMEATLDQPVNEKPGAVIGPYKLLQQIGEGGMGVVYMAEQTEPVERRVALKIIKPGMDTRQVIARFEAERQALAMMDHPNIAKVFDAGTTGGNPKCEARNTKQIGRLKSEIPNLGEVSVSDIRDSHLEFVSDFGFRHSDFSPGRPYFVMELVKGVPITQYCDEHHLTPRQRLELLVPVCQAVQHAHQKGIIHRDIKPSNVLVAEYDDRPVPKVIDFGVAKAIEQRLTEKSMFTQFGQVVGTIDYMSPEQAKLNQLDIDTRSDIYSLGVLLYELLTGETPLDRERLRSAAFDEMLRIIREEEPPKPSIRLSSSQSLPSIAANRQTEPKKLSTLVRGELDWIVMKALEKERTRRYETANGLAHDIERYLNDEPVQACPPSAAYRFKKFARRNKVGFSFAVLILLFLVLLGSAIGWAVRDREAREQEIAWESEARQARLSEHVQLIFDEVGRLQQEQKWPEALAAAKRAEAALAGGEAPEDLRAGVGQVLADLEMVRRLEEIRLLASEVNEQGFDHRVTNRDYGAAFSAYGVDVDVLPADDAAAWLRSRTRVLPALIVALDDWARCRRAAKDEAGAKVLTDVAQALDRDPWRRRMREALAVKNEKAIDELAGSAELARQSPSTVCLVARTLEKSGKPERALEVLGRALGEHPDDFWLHFDAGSASDSCRPPRNDEEILHLRVALALRPRSVAVLNNLGVVLKDQGKLEEAIACYRKAIELDPKLAMAHSNLGAALTDQGKLDEAIACCRKAIELDPKFASAHANLGNPLFHQGKLDEAIACCRKAIELDPKLAAAHNLLGNALTDQGKLDEAIACCRKAIELDPKFACAHSNLGNALFNQGKPDEAIACYRKAIELDPRFVVGHSNLGNVLERQGKFDEAIACQRKVIELRPKYARGHFDLGVAFYNRGSPDEAIACWRKSVELNPKSVLAYSNLGVALGNRGKQDEAIVCWRKVVELDPKSAGAHSNLAWHLATAADPKVIDFPNAREHARKATELVPQDPNAWEILGVAQYRCGDFTGAVATLEKVGRMPGAKLSLDADFFLAMAYWRAGNQEAARKCYTEAVARSKNQPHRFRAEAERLMGIIAAGKAETEKGKAEKQSK